MPRDLERDVHTTHPGLLVSDENIVGVFGALPRGSGMAMLNERVTGSLKHADEHEAVHGLAETIPSKTRFVAVTSERLIFFAGRMATRGGAPSDLLMEVPLDSVDEIQILQKGHYVGFAFADGSAAALVTNATKQFKRFAQVHTGATKPW